MPIYEYECDTCERIFEVIHRASKDTVENCEVCGSPVRRRISPPAIHFKGSGWYVTDYGTGSKGKPESKEKGKKAGETKKSSESKDSKGAGGGSSDSGSSSGS